MSSLVISMNTASVAQETSLQLGILAHLTISLVLATPPCKVQNGQVSSVYKPLPESGKD